MRAFKPAHPQCIYSSAIELLTIEKLMSTGKTIHLDDEIVEYLYNIVMKGF